MPQSHLWIKEEMRLLGAIQAMNGLIVESLGVIWTYLYATQVSVFRAIYIPLVTMSGYPFWASLSFITSGFFAVMLQKKPSYSLIFYTIVVSIISACAAVIGLLLILMEFLIFSLSPSALWSHRSGKMLSEYMFIFISLELVVAAMVVNWSYKAHYTA